MLGKWRYSPALGHPRTRINTGLLAAPKASPIPSLFARIVTEQLCDMFLRKATLLVLIALVFFDAEVNVSMTPRSPFAAPLDYYLPTPPASDTIEGVSIRDVTVDSTLRLSWSRVRQVRRLVPVTQNTCDYIPVFYLDESNNKLTLGAVQVFVPTR